MTNTKFIFCQCDKFKLNTESNQAKTNIRVLKPAANPFLPTTKCNKIINIANNDVGKTSDTKKTATKLTKKWWNSRANAVKCAMHRDKTKDQKTTHKNGLSHSYLFIISIKSLLVNLCINVWLGFHAHSYPVRNLLGNFFFLFSPNTQYDLCLFIASETICWLSVQSTASIVNECWNIKCNRRITARI